MTATDTPVRPSSSPWRKAVYDVLSDYQWHPLGTVIAKTAAQVPPQVAMNFFRRSTVRKWSKTPGTNRRLTERADQLRSARFQYVRQLLLTMGRDGLVALEGTGAERRIRLLPADERISRRR